MSAVTPVNLITSYYKDKNPNRQAELDYCLNKNSKSGFNSINLFVESRDKQFVESGIIKGFEKNPKIIYTNSRPTYNEYLKLIDTPAFANSINIISNTDIFIEDIDAIRRYVNGLANKNRTCLALSRWDWWTNGSVLYDRADSQDTWIFFGNPNFRTSIDFTMGIAGCDNRFAHEIGRVGFNIINPAKTLKTYHFHNTNIRNYIDNRGNVQRVPPPYKTVPTIF